MKGKWCVSNLFEEENLRWRKCPLTSGFFLRNNFDSLSVLCVCILGVWILYFWQMLSIWNMVIIDTVCSGVSVIMCCILAVQNDANHYQMLNGNLKSFSFTKFSFFRCFSKEQSHLALIVSVYGCCLCVSGVVLNDSLQAFKCFQWSASLRKSKFVFVYVSISCFLQKTWSFKRWKSNFNSLSVDFKNKSFLFLVLRISVSLNKRKREKSWNVEKLWRNCKHFREFLSVNWAERL